MDTGLLHLQNKEKPRRISVQVLIKRWVFFSFFMGLFVVFLYMVGNVQGFMDATQVFLLNLVSYLCLFLAVGAFFGFAQTLFFAFRKKEPKPKSGRHLMSALLYALLTLFGVFGALAAVLIISASKGNML